MEELKVIATGILDVKEIDKLKEFPKEYGVQRMKSKGNVTRIKESMEKIYIPSIIRVNQDWYILDGQHSKEAIKELKLENQQIVYVMYDTKGKDKDVCVLLNTTSKKWDVKDFLEIWVSAGNENYIWLKNIWEKYDLNYQTLIYMVTGMILGGNKNTTDIDFKNGNLVIPQENRQRAIRIAEQLKDVRDVMPKEIKNKRVFHKAFVKIALNKEYDHKRMVSKLNYQLDRIHKCSSETGYFELLQDIYNYKSSKKVYFTER